MSASGSPSTATMSAILPASSVPRSLSQLERLGGVAGGGLDGVHRRHAELDVDFQLERVRAHVRLEAHVGAHRDLDARLVESSGTSCSRTAGSSSSSSG